MSTIAYGVEVGVYAPDEDHPESIEVVIDYRTTEYPVRIYVNGHEVSA